MSFADRFVLDSDQFTPSSPGQAFGNHRLVIDFAGGPYGFDGLSATQTDRIRERFQDLCSEDTSRQVKVNTLLYRTQNRSFPDFDLDNWEYTLDFEYKEASVGIAGLKFFAYFDLRQGKQSHLWTSTEDDDYFTGVFENYFRVVVAYRLLACGGVLLHSAGVIDEGNAYLFFGPSNAGKTTVSRLSQDSGHSVLSDDINALLAGPAQDVVAEKMPFAGELGQTATPSGTYPVRGLFRLHQGPRNAVRDMRPSEGIAALVACSPYVNADPVRQDRLFENLEHLSTITPVRHLTFSLDQPLWPLLTGH
ncbi:MAG: hypothetical protein GXP09_08135 [Gammaproteobacteria bacterium]|nr:hypothetical protein [Gammaproteobacteria bacterium]